MARLARGEYVDPNVVQMFHAFTRCVRRAHLCGKDQVTGKSFEHRRQWIADLLELFASAFAIDCLTFAVMSNHLHLVLRSRPDLAQSWSDIEVARRWLMLCKPKSGAEATEADIETLAKNTQQIDQLRTRLSDISWWMRLLNQTIARRANREDDCVGRFWEGRFKAQSLLDEAAILACAMYVDLNPIRAAMAQSLEESRYTGAKARVDDLLESNLGGEAANKPGQPVRGHVESILPKRGKYWATHQWERAENPRNSGWLSPIEIDERTDPTGLDPCETGRRASRRGFLSMPLTQYLELLDWTGRQVRQGKRGAIPPEVSPILERLGIDSDRWLDLTCDFGSIFKRAAGSAVALSKEATRRGQRWLQAPGVTCFL